MLMYVFRILSHVCHMYVFRIVSHVCHMYILFVPIYTGAQVPGYNPLCTFVFLNSLYTTLYVQLLATTVYISTVKLFALIATCAIFPLSILLGKIINKEKQTKNTKEPIPSLLYL
jgi:hypothetical protein